jgi:hypothetical protein
LDQKPEMFTQFRSAAGDVDNGRAMLRNPISDATSGFGRDHFGPPWTGINMAMTAGLITFATHVNLKRFDPRAPKRDTVFSKLLVETVHVSRQITR